MADPVGAGQADPQHVRGRALPQSLGLQQVFSGLQRLFVQQRRGVELQTRGRQHRMEGLAADGPVAGPSAALIALIVPGHRVCFHPGLEAGVEGGDGRQFGLRRLAWLDKGGQAEAVGEPEGLPLMTGQIDRAAILA